MQGSVNELMGLYDDALFAYERALLHNHSSIRAMAGIALILKKREKYSPAIDYLNKVLQLDPTNGELWGELGTSSSSKQSEQSKLIHVKATAS
jgi:glucose repression mediator protein